MAFADTYRGKRVLVTGHTGFKGAWLCEWLLHLGANVTGYSIDVPTTPSLFNQLNLASRLTDCRGDIRDEATVSELVDRIQPDFVFHLAAQSLVRPSYQRPIETWQVNVAGTMNILNALRLLQKPCGTVIVTTDKCYENHESSHRYQEGDKLGGSDPYSSSKAACELAINSWRTSFFREHPVKIASARAGNVIGGGDWAADRIIPDVVRALLNNQSINVRNPASSRPWQHVLEPISAYLWLGTCLAESTPESRGETRCTAFNFGPKDDATRSVRDLVGEVLKVWPGTWIDGSDGDAPREAKLLQICVDKAKSQLGWTATWEFEESVRQTIEWYRSSHLDTKPDSVRDLTLRQIEAYSQHALRQGSSWAAH